MVQSLNKQPKLLDQVRYAIRTKHYSYRTEEAYVNWIIRFILYHNKRHPKEMGAKEINQFLTYLAVEDIDFGNNCIMVRDGKGAKDRVTALPEIVKAPLKEHLLKREKLHQNMS